MTGHSREHRIGNGSAGCHPIGSMIGLSPVILQGWIELGRGRDVAVEAATRPSHDGRFSSSGNASVTVAVPTVATANVLAPNRFLSTLPPSP